MTSGMHILLWIIFLLTWKKYSNNNRKNNTDLFASEVTEDRQCLDFCNLNHYKLGIISQLVFMFIPKTQETHNVKYHHRHL